MPLVHEVNEVVANNQAILAIMGENRAHGEFRISVVDGKVVEAAVEIRSRRRKNTESKPGVNMKPLLGE